MEGLSWWHTVILIVKAWCHHLFKILFVTIIFVFCFMIRGPGGYANPIDDWTKKSEVEITAVVTGAVGDTRWLYVSSRQEMNCTLAAYYTGPLLEQLSESAWNFIRVPTDWQYVIKAGNCRVTAISGDKANACVDILESDEIAGVTFSSRVEYLLVKTESGWKIAGVEKCS